MIVDTMALHLNLCDWSPSLILKPSLKHVKKLIPIGIKPWMVHLQMNIEKQLKKKSEL